MTQTPSSFTLVKESATVVLDPLGGGRVRSIRVGDIDVIAGRPDGGDETSWGLFPMVPFAGRVRDSRFAFDGRRHLLEGITRDGAHALHGTLLGRAGTVERRLATTVLFSSDLGPAWPFTGTVKHVVHLSENRLDFGLTLTAHERMPAQVGWHPWFPKPARIEADFERWLPRDADGMPGEPTASGLPRLDDEVDDCFEATGSPVTVVTGGLDVVLESDCSHWVVYTGADHGVCVEPQSGPPNAVNTGPQILEAGESLTRRLTLRWQDGDGGALVGAHVA